MTGDGCNTATRRTSKAEASKLGGEGYRVGVGLGIRLVGLEVCIWLEVKELRQGFKKIGSNGASILLLGQKS